MAIMDVVGRVLNAGARKQVERLIVRAEAICELKDDVVKLSDEQLAAKTEEFKKRLADGETLDDILDEAFACVREAGRRAIGLEHFPVQLVGGMVLHEGKIAEMKTGEGKTLVATLAVYLNTLEGKGVHVVTVNDYLAKRDAEWMGPVYRALDLKVGVIQTMMDFDQRRQAYNADVTYGTNSEFGFDYLRDNMVTHPEERVQRGHHYAIVDEVDSILIDEARTPLIISGMHESAGPLYAAINDVVGRMKTKTVAHEPITPEEKDEDAALEEHFDYVAYEKERHCKETPRGQERLARAFGMSVEDLFGGEGGEERKELTFEEAKLRHDVLSIFRQSMIAHALYRKDRDYVVRAGEEGREVMIVDEFTGRIMEGRRYSEGLHQAIEAKEKVRIREENQTLATITLQNYFRMYEKLAGMTGTAMTEEAEFRHIYKLETVEIPPHRPVVRDDMPDLIYKTADAKFDAVVEDIIECQQRGQPALVGTISVEKSEHLSKLLRKRGVKHEVLNAKHHAREGAIIAQAGRVGAVTIATNMAGRGVDIMLGGNPQGLAMQKLGVSDLEALETQFSPEEREAGLSEARQITEPEHVQVVEVGGLRVIATERHESRRIDNQLRGRSGRQGDPGSTQFYLSLEDDLMRLFGSHRIASVMERLQWPEDMPIEHGMITKSIETAQRQVESQNFEARKHVLEYDDVMNKQRELIYTERGKILAAEDLTDLIEDAFREFADGVTQMRTAQGKYPEEWDIEGLVTDVNQIFPLPWGAGDLNLEDLTREELADKLLDSIHEAYKNREEELGAEMLRELERIVLLQVIDTRWREHLYEMDYLRESIGLRAVGQRDPLVEYTNEGFAMFEEMIAGVKEDFVNFIFQVQVAIEPEPEAHRPSVFETVPAGEGAMAAGEPVAANKSGKAKKKAKAHGGVGRNDPCPCGSGKKYKKCCGA